MTAPSELRVTEDQLLNRILELAALLGWRTAHFRPAQTGRGWRTAVQGDGKGFPDIVATRGPRLMFAELKSATGRLSVEQAAWVADLEGVPGVETYVWRPSDWESIEQTLKRGPHGN